MEDKVIVVGSKKFRRVTATVMCKGCAVYTGVPNGCQLINNAARSQHSMDDCMSNGIIYAEVS